jgi:hypothetical protein
MMTRKKNLRFILAIMIIVQFFNQGCSSLGELPSGMTWYKPGISTEQTQLDWLECQQAALQAESFQTTSDQSQATQNQLYNSSGTVQPNAYGLGVNSDQYGRPTTYQLQNGQQLDPIFNAGVKQNAYGPGIGQDQFGRPVYNAPYYGAGTSSGYYDGGQSSGVGDQIALNALSVMTENSRAKNLMVAKGYKLVSTNSPALKDRPEHFTDADFK